MSGGMAPKTARAGGEGPLVNPTSLWRTLDMLSDAFHNGRLLSYLQRAEAAHWIAKRHGQAGAYANMFAPTALDRRHGVRVYTGEKISSKAGTAHVLGEEACRALILLEISEPTVLSALEEAEAGIRERVEASEKRSPNSMGWYCCGTCSVAFWRHLIVGGVNWSERRLLAGQQRLKEHRAGKGKWKRVPYWYALLALSEMDGPAAREECRYAAPGLERYLKRKMKADVNNTRRRAVAERVLALC